jgi:exopolysaccharide biosynthesis polyprenyl glycosylphosphotransferase
MVLLALRGAYDRRVVGLGPEEYKRVLRASLWVVAVVATVSFLGRVDVARGWILLGLPVGTLFLLTGRFVARKRWHRALASGDVGRRVLAVGDPAHVRRLTATLERESYAGYRVVGACVPEESESEVGGIPVVGHVSNVRRAVLACGADTVAVASLSGSEPDFLRRLAWSLEGLGVDLVLAPSLTDVAGPRIHVRPLAGLPLLHVDEPELTGVRRLGKLAFDAVGSLVLTILWLPLMAVAAVAIRLDDHGPVLFRQTRVGEGGEPFTMYKLRTMEVGADDRIGSLEELNESDGVLFKIENDPRVTRTGRFLRRWSLDELPQLFNVVRGEMSLVGPRPPLPREVAQYSETAQRRLLVKPGMTGLWQISGRADLSWEDSLRLDLWYVENWSFSQDIVILLKTTRAVLSLDGAY